jgi:AcrR family transcriptional regulator
MGSDDRRARERVEVQEKILAAARDLFVKEGIEAVSMRKIAAAIDYTAAGLYTHFKDKDELVRSLCRHDFAAFGQTMGRLGKVADPIERIAQMGMAYIRFAAEHPSHYRMMFMTPNAVARTDEDLKCGTDPKEGGYAALRHAVAEGVEAGKFRIKDAELLTQTLWAGVHGVASLQITKVDEEWIHWRVLERRARHMVDTLLLGTLSPAAAKEYQS